MKNITKYALQGILPNTRPETIDRLVEIVEATPNPELALDMLAGEYATPTFPKTTTSDKGVVRTFLSYNPWNDRISYSFEQQKKVQIYLKDGVNPEDVTPENYKEMQQQWSSTGENRSHNVLFDQYDTKFDSCNAADWK